MNTRDELASIRQRAEAATEGPWAADPESYIVNRGDDMICADLLTHYDAEFIAHARTDIPRLLGALDAVLALHTEDEQGKCAECTVAPFSVHSVKWPCPTVAAVNDALEAAK